MLYFIRIVAIVLFVALGGLIGLILCLVRPFHRDNIFDTARFFKLGLKILGIKVRVQGEFPDPKKGPYVYISNHQENMDVFIGAHLIPRDTVTIGKRDIIFIPFFGLFYALSGNILINRQNKKEAFGAMDKALSQMKSKAISVWILPEGTRSKGRGLLPFKKGAFHLALKGQYPVVPVAISFFKHLDLNRLESGTIMVEIMDPITIDHSYFTEVNLLRDHSYQLIANSLQQMDRELDEQKKIAARK